MVFAIVVHGGGPFCSVFRRDWDSLEEQSVRHACVLAVCVPVHPAGGLGERGPPDEPLHPARSVLPFLSPHSFALLLSPSSAPPPLLSSISQQEFMSCDSLKPIISSPPTSIPSQPLGNNTQPLDQSPERPAAGLMLIKESIVVDLCCQSQSSWAAQSFSRCVLSLCR